jgi:hypothetical protein
MTMAELNSDDRYQLRKLQMDVEKKELEVQKTKQELERFILELEHKYNLMDSGQVIDPRTGTVSGSSPARNGKGRTEAAPATEKGEGVA